MLLPKVHIKYNNIPTKRNIFSICGAGVHTSKFSLMLWSLCIELRYSVCILWEETGALMVMFLCT